MSKIENNRIYYDPYNEIRCDKFALEKFVKESEEKDKTIADLEAKLAEKSKELQECKIGDKNTQDALFSKIQKLEQQLADTEAQNKRVLEKLELIVSANQELDKENELMAKTLRMTKCIEKEINQDKISFAVEQLEKVKELLLSKAIQITGTSVDGVRLYSINEIFSNQIKQLKEMN